MLTRPALALEETVRMEGLRGEGKSKSFFSDFTSTDSGLQFKDFKVGSGPAPQSGDKVVVDWTGVTIGYQGRYFQARNKPKGGAFEGDGFLDFLRFTVGDGSVIPGIDEAVRTMSAGSVRRIIVPEEIGYPSTDRPAWKNVGPAPSTFSGERALDFVLSSRCRCAKEGAAPPALSLCLRQPSLCALRRAKHVVAGPCRRGS